MVFNPALPPKDGYTVMQDWLDGMQSYIEAEGSVRQVTGSYTANGSWPSILLPFTPKRLCIYGSTSGVMVYWNEGMGYAVVMGTYGSYAYIGSLTITLTQSGENTLLSLQHNYIVKLNVSGDVLNGNDVYKALGTSGYTYQYEAWG